MDDAQLRRGYSYSSHFPWGGADFVADEALVQKLAQNGQIATQYVDLEGDPTANIRFNPNNSVQAVEGITSPDGRVFGKMGHSERYGENLYKNVPDKMPHETSFSKAR